MVQRKVVNKLLGSLKPSSSHHHQDNNIKNRGADMKKKIKKSRSIKHPDMEFLTTTATPTPKVPAQVRDQKSPEKKKSAPKKTPESTPNYMKSTSSSDAKKENSQSHVSFRNLLPLTFHGNKSCSRKASISNNTSEAVSAASNHNKSARPSRASLKLVRTLTKTTSFKPARASAANKCSPLVLTETLDFKRKTCSSTLKDSKFPGYLTLDPGGSEAEGTSAMKVCPYTYCSLNGHHHHHPLPPLKSFLSARRRILKAQRSIKLGCLSPRRSKPSKEAIAEVVNFDNVPSGAESTSKNSMVTPVIIQQEEQDDFFIDIYSNEKETIIADTTKGASKIGSQCNSDENGDMEGNQYGEEVDEEAYLHLLAAEESGDEAESTGRSIIDDLESGNSDMDWEGGRYSTLYLDDVDDADNSVECESFVINQGSILMSDHGALNNSNLERVQTDELKTKSLDEESISSNGDFHEHFQGSGDQTDDQHQLMAADESNGDVKKSNSVGSSTANFSMIPLESDIARVNTQVKDASIQTEVDAFTDYCVNQFVENDDADEQTSHLDFQDMAAQSQAEDEECSRNNVKFYQCDAHIVVNCTNLQPFSGNTLPKKMDSHSETNCFKVNAAEAAVKVAPFTANITIDIILSLQDSSEKNHKDAMERDEKSNQPEPNIDFPGGTQYNTSESEESIDLNIRSCDSTDSSDQPHSAVTEISVAAAAEQELKKIEMDTTSSLGAQHNSMETKEGNLDGEQGKTYKNKNSNWTNKRKISTEEEEGPSEFNPRAPNFLPLEEEQKPEKVDLRHQMIDDRRNTEEWMLDYALQQTLTKLAPARKKKVALLVEAFEKVMPITRCDSQIRHSSVEFAESPRPIQACS